MNKSQTGATLSGSYSVLTGTLTETGFEYGTSSSSLTSSIGISIGRSNVSTTGESFSEVLSNLSPGTTYYCRAYAKVQGTGDKSSTVSTFYSSTKSFTTQSRSTSRCCGFSHNTLDSRSPGPIHSRVFPSCALRGLRISYLVCRNWRRGRSICRLSG